MNNTEEQVRYKTKIQPRLQTWRNIGNKSRGNRWENANTNQVTRGRIKHWQEHMAQHNHTTHVLTWQDRHVTEYLWHVSVFDCIVSILWHVSVFVACFCIWLCCEYLWHVSVFGCVVNICGMFLYLVVLWVFGAHMCCETDEDVFLIWGCFSICMFPSFATHWALSATIFFSSKNLEKMYNIFYINIKH